MGGWGYPRNMCTKSDVSVNKASAVISGEITCKRPHKTKKKTLFHYNNPRIPKLWKVLPKINALHLKSLRRPPYSVDLAPRDYCLFFDLKRNLPPQLSGVTGTCFFKIKRFKTVIYVIEMLARLWKGCAAVEKEYFNFTKINWIYLWIIFHTFFWIIFYESFLSYFWSQNSNIIIFFLM